MLGWYMLHMVLCLCISGYACLSQIRVLSKGLHIAHTHITQCCMIGRGTLSRILVKFQRCQP